ncbi:hypothetical protein Tco_1215831 [Tanacetum coccineum]
MLRGRPPIKASKSFSLFEAQVLDTRVPVRYTSTCQWQQSCASRAAVKSAVSCRMASKVMAGVSDVDVLLGGILSTKDNTRIEEEDGGMDSLLSGNSSSGIKKYRGSNSNDGGNTGDGVKIAGGVIGSGDEIEFFEELKELLSDEAEK